MSLESSKMILRQFFEILNTRTFAEFDTLLGPKFVWHGNNDQSLKDYKKDVSDLCRAFPDGRWEVDDLVAEADKVVVRWIFMGKQTRPWMELPATNRRVKYAGTSICRIAGGRIVEVWNNENLLRFFRQLGFQLQPPDAG